MKVRGTPSAAAAVPALVVAALIVTALVAVIGAAQAAPSKKNYGAIVDVTSGAPLTSTSARLRLTLTNDQKSNQTIGSANFVAPGGVHVQSVVVQPPPPVPPDSTTSRSGWRAAKNGDVVEFRSTSNALSPSASVYADVNVTIDATECGNATWTIFVKQSNDFSGSGNDFSPSASVNARPLGSFDIARIETPDEEDPTIVVPQIKTNVDEVVQVTARDICNDLYGNYGTSLGNTAVFDAEPNVPPRLVNAGNLAINWADPGAGTGSTTLNPKFVETGDTLVITDALTTPGVSIGDVSNVFDVVEELCTSEDEVCDLDNGKIHVFGAGPTAPDNPTLPDPSLGFGFSSDLDFKCPGDGSIVDPIGDAVVNINPRDYPTNDPITVTVVYDKSETGNGPATSFSVCLSKDNGETWGEPLSECSNDPQASEAPCVSRKRVTGGDLSVAFWIRPTDPWGGAR